MSQEQSVKDFDLLKLSERLQLAIQLGESHFREFKSALQGPPNAKTARPARDVCCDISEALVAFANADGGELLVGVEDDGTVTGVEYPEDKLQHLLEAPKTHIHQDTPLPPPRVTKLEFHDKLVLYFSVSKGTSFIYLTSNGRCLQRKDRESVPISSESIRFSRAEIVSREYDRAFIDGATTADLDGATINQVAELVSRGMSVEKFLQHMDLAEFDGMRFRLRRAALLLFAKQPHKWHPRSQVRLLRINGTELKTGEEFNVLVDQEVSDNIMMLLESSWELLRPHLTETRFSAEARFRSQIMYPELACREALVNAIAHRDYSAEGRGVEVRVYTDRLEIESPGGLLSSVRIDDLVKLSGAHQSRNSLVARVLRESGYMRELGEGVRRMFELMRSNDLQPPELETTASSFSVTLHHRYIYSREERIWLDGFQDLNLTHDQSTIVRLGYNGHLVSPKEIWDAVGIVDTDYYRRLLVELRNKGILEHVVNKDTAVKTARQKRVHVKEVPRFKIVMPGTPLSLNVSPLTSPAKQSKPGRILGNEGEKQLASKDEKIHQINTGAEQSAFQVDELDDNDYTKVYVGNLPFAFESSALSEEMSKFGSVVDVIIPTNKFTGRSKGFGFVEFDSKEGAEKAIAASLSIKLDGRSITIAPSMKKGTK